VVTCRATTLGVPFIGRERPSWRAFDKANPTVLRIPRGNKAFTSHGSTEGRRVLKTPFQFIIKLSQFNCSRQGKLIQSGLSHSCLNWGSQTK
jgi:hypothetical protein